MSKANINHTPKRWSNKPESVPCAGCEYRNHCSGKKDAVTHIPTVSADSCDAFEAYGQLQKYEELSRIPYRVRHAQFNNLISKHIKREEQWAGV